MLYQCCQDGRVINIATSLYLSISDNELLRLCTEGNGIAINDPWFKSFADTAGVLLTPEQIEEQEELEYEESTEFDLLNSVDLNIIDDDFFE